MPNNFLTTAVKEFEEKMKKGTPVLDSFERACLLNAFRFALEAYQAKIREMVEGMKKDKLYVGKTQYEYYKGNVDFVYNAALSDLLSNELLNNK